MSKELLQRSKQASIEKEKAMKAEPFQVELLFETQPNIIRVTYKNITSATIIAIEELDLDGNPITYSSVKGRRVEGNVHQSVINLLPILRIKPTCWYHNPEKYLESYYLKH